MGRHDPRLEDASKSVLYFLIVVSTASGIWLIYTLWNLPLSHHNYSEMVSKEGIATTWLILLAIGAGFLVSIAVCIRGSVLCIKELHRRSTPGSGLRPPGRELK